MNTSPLPGTRMPTVSANDAKPRRSESPSRRSFRRFAKHRLAVAGAIALCVIILIAISAPLVAPQDPLESDLQALRQPPSGAHWLGTDLIGRDVWSRVAHGGRISLAVGILAVPLYMLIGTLLGALAGYFGGVLDQTIMRVTDTILSVPALLMVIVFVAIVGPSLTSVIIVISLLGWPRACRIVRGQILLLRNEEYVAAARAQGANVWHIINWHILPNIVGPLTVTTTFGIANAILLEATLSFLGLGVSPPTPTWGGMLFEAQSPTILSYMPWLWLAPGFFISITVLAVNLVGDGIRDAMDPRATTKQKE